MILHRITVLTVEVFNPVQPVLLIIKPFIFYFPSASSCKYHFFQIPFCQFYTAYPLEPDRLLIFLFILCFILIFKHIHDFCFSGNFFHMVRIKSCSFFFAQPCITYAIFTSFYPFKSLIQFFLSGVFLGKQIFPVVFFPAQFHDWFRGVKCISLNTDWQSWIILFYLF